jgi:hypothetical protein
MGIGYNPKITTNGLTLCLDAANTNKSAKGFKSILNLSSWTLGTGGVTGFTPNGSVAENQRILDTGPFGVSTLVWDTPSNDATSDGDGGWDIPSPYISIDPTKLYRFSVWLRRKTIGNGSFYLGCYGINSGNNNEGVLQRSSGAVNTNPYFSSGAWPTGSISAGNWMLVVGHVWPAGSGTGSVHVDSGLWNTAGTKFSVPYNDDFVWQATSARTTLRSYLYYSTDTTTNQQWYQPRIDLVDGTEPSIPDLISGVGSLWYDISGNSNNGSIRNSPALYNSAGYMRFDGLDDFISLPSPSGKWNWTPSGGGNNNLTIDLWIKSSDTTGNIVSKPWNGNGEYNYRIEPGGVWVQVNTQSFFLAFTSIATNIWTNLVVVITPTQVGAYINGVLNAGFSNHSITTNTPQYGDISLPLTIMTLYPYGSEWAGNTGFSVAGDLASLKMYGRALSASEIKQNFNSIRGRYGI